MFRSFVKDESGMALGLAIVMIVLVGVMGAGLLVFVRNDLEAVIEANQGRKALDAADAGVQVAEERLRLDADPESYDGEADSTITFGGSPVNIKIRHLKPAEDGDQARQTDHAPEVLPEEKDEYPGDSNYFQVVSEGVAGDARRIVESIYRTRPGEQPGSYAVERWSWRECYSEDCG